MTKRTNLSYTRLENDLRQDILSNRLAGGEALPTEKELSDRYGISRNTVRHALANLVNEGLLSKVHGSGTLIQGQRFLPESACGLHPNRFRLMTVLRAHGYAA